MLRTTSAGHDPPLQDSVPASRQHCRRSRREEVRPKRKRPTMSRDPLHGPPFGHCPVCTPDKISAGWPDDLPPRDPGRNSAMARTAWSRDPSQAIRACTQATPTPGCNQPRQFGNAGKRSNKPFCGGQSRVDQENWTDHEIHKSMINKEKLPDQPAVIPKSSRVDQENHAHTG